MYIKPLLFFCPLFLASSTDAKVIDSTFEVKLELIQTIEKQQVSGSFLAASIINHSKRDLFIPRFNSYQINYYRKTDSAGWKEIDLNTHNFYKEHTMPKPPNGENVPWSPPYEEQVSKIPTSFQILKSAVHKTQDSIWNQYIKQSGQKQQARYVIGFPLCIKAGETIRFYNIYNIDYFIQEPGEFRIAFNMENRYPETRTLKYLNQLPVKTPASILSYQLYIPKSFLTNTIHYTTMRIEQLKKEYNLQYEKAIL